MQTLITTFVVVLAFAISYVPAVAQTIPLSPSVLKKINQARIGRERLLLYHKTLKRDSIRTAKQLLRKLKNSVDSAVDAQEEWRRRSENGDIDLGRIVPRNSPSSIEGNLDSIVRLRGRRNLPHSPVNDELEGHPVGKMGESPDVNASKILPGEEDQSQLRAQLPKVEQFRQGPDRISSHLEKSSDNHSDVIRNLGANIERDEVILDNKPERIPSVNSISSSELNGLSEKKLPDASIPDTHFGSAERALSSYADPALDKTRSLWQEFDGKVISAQKKLSRLMSRYRRFTATDSSIHGVKHSSLEGRPFVDRLYAGLNFSPFSFDPFVLNARPELGYKIDKRLIVGGGVNLALGGADSTGINFVMRLSSYHVFTSFTLYKSIYAYMEMQSSPSVVANAETSTDRWQPTYFAGVGKRMLIHPKAYLTVLATYRLSSADHNALSGNRFQLRVGFERSELSRKRKRFFYHPNQ